MYKYLSCLVQAPVFRVSAVTANAPGHEAGTVFDVHVSSQAH